MSFGIGACWLVISIIEDILNDLTELNQIVKKFNKSEWELKIRFCDVVQTFSDAKELSEKFLLDLFS